MAIRSRSSRRFIAGGRPLIRMSRAQSLTSNGFILRRPPVFLSLVSSKEGWPSCGRLPPARAGPPVSWLREPRCDPPRPVRPLSGPIPIASRRHRSRRPRRRSSCLRKGRISDADKASGDRRICLPKPGTAPRSHSGPVNTRRPVRPRNASRRGSRSPRAIGGTRRVWTAIDQRLSSTSTPGMARKVSIRGKSSSRRFSAFLSASLPGRSRRPPGRRHSRPLPPPR